MDYHIFWFDNGEILEMFADFKEISSCSISPGFFMISVSSDNDSIFKVNRWNMCYLYL